MFIVFEGIDGCGKTTLSKHYADKYNYYWTKEPTFSSEEADRLNLGSKDDIEREVEFCIDRIKHQDEIKVERESRDFEGLICDRYIWSGLAYSKLFNPSAYDFAKAMYKHDFFIKPDIYVYVDTPINVCMSRGRDQTNEQLENLKKAYVETMYLVSQSSYIIIIKGEGSIGDCIENLHKQIKEAS